MLNPASTIFSQNLLRTRVLNNHTRTILSRLLQNNKNTASEYQDWGHEIDRRIGLAVQA